MTKLSHILASMPLLRRRRHWRYVSRGRRTAGLILLALLSVVLFAYIYLPLALGGYASDKAERYLSQLTAGRVEIRGGKFGLWGTLELRGVRIDVPNAPATGRPLLTAESILLRHRPWTLFSEGRLDVTEIVCVAPTLTLDYDAEKGRLVAWEMLEAMRRPAGEPAMPPPQRLPLISFRDVQLQTLNGQMRLDITMSPEGATKYAITLRENRPGGQQPISGSGTLDVVRGSLDLSTTVFIEDLAPMLPEHYARWKDRYGIEGKVLLNSVRARHDPNSQALEAVLEGVRLRLTEAEGGLSLTDVSGRLVFDSNELRVTNLTGRLPQAGGAALRLDGRYGGYDPNSSFELKASVRGLALPAEKDVTGATRKVLAELRRALQPGGTVDATIDVRRDANGVIVDGTAWPRNMTATYCNFRYPVSNVTGTVEFDMSRVRLKDVSGRHGEGTFTLNGTVDLRKAWTYEWTIDVVGAAFDEALRAALPENIVKVWNTVSPSGHGGAKVRIRRQGEDDEERIDVLLMLDGRAAVAYDGFPYRLEKVSGAVHIVGDEAELEDVRARHGPASIALRGTVGGLSGRKGHTRVTIDANDLAIDSDLLAAMPPRTRRSVEELHVTAGRAASVRVKLSEDPGERMDMRIEAGVEGAAFRPDVLPYAVTDANGELAILNDKAVLRRLVGRHGETPVTISGTIALEANQPGTDLLITAKALRLDEELLAALPPGVKAAWRDVNPEGQADIELTYREVAGPKKSGVDYRLVIDGRGGISVRHEAFPYPLRNIVGRAVATPGRVELQNVTAVRAESKLTVAGVLSEDANGTRVDLSSVKGQAVPVDKDFLAAMPAALGPIVKRFQAGGTCDLDLRNVRVFTPALDASAARAPASGPASRATTRPGAPASTWSLGGGIAFRNATIDLGLGYKKVTGGLTGGAEQDSRGLALDANVDVDSMVVARQQLTSLSGRLTKDRTAQIMRIGELTARAYGGRAAGFAEVRLSDPLEYGLNLTVEGIELEELARAGLEAGKKPDVKGKLAGTLQLTATPTSKPALRAVGLLRLSDGSVCRLPVMLGLLHVFFLSLPGDTAFTDGTVSYRLQDDTLTFEEIYLRGPALSILGSGTMSMKSEALKLNFLTGPPRKLPRIGSIEELLQGLSREVVEIHVRGSLRNPQMRTVPLRGLDKAIHELLNPGKAEK